MDQDCPSCSRKLPISHPPMRNGSGHVKCAWGPWGASSCIDLKVWAKLTGRLMWLSGDTQQFLQRPTEKQISSKSMIIKSEQPVRWKSTCTIYIQKQHTCNLQWIAAHIIHCLSSTGLLEIVYTGSVQLAIQLLGGSHSFLPGLSPVPLLTCAMWFSYSGPPHRKFQWTQVETLSLKFWAMESSMILILQQVLLLGQCTCDSTCHSTVSWSHHSPPEFVENVQCFQSTQGNSNPQRFGQWKSIHDINFSKFCYRRVYTEISSNCNKLCLICHGLVGTSVVRVLNHMNRAYCRESLLNSLCFWLFQMERSFGVWKVLLGAEVAMIIHLSSGSYKGIQSLHHPFLYEHRFANSWNHSLCI